MVISGRQLATNVLDSLREQIVQHDLKPKLVIIRAGSEPASEIYIKYKKNAAEKIGIDLEVLRFDEAQYSDCIRQIVSSNDDQNTHGIIVQLPLYNSWQQHENEVLNLIKQNKDVDGFLEDSPYIPATAEAIWMMLNEFSNIDGFDSISQFLSDKKIVVLGKGKTAGKPFRDLLTKKGYSSDLIDSKTVNPNEIIKSADVIITATGKKNIINKENTKTGAYVIGVGVGKEIINGEEKTFGDVNENEIKEVAKMYCPTIGGIGPLTIACLLKNVVNASKAH